MKKSISVILGAFLVFFVSLIVMNCSRSVHQPKEKMTAQQLYEKQGIKLPDLLYAGEEEATAPPNSNSKKKQSAASVQVTVEWSYNLGIDITGTTITGGVSPDAYCVGAQKFVDTTTIDGAVGLWECDRFYQSPPGAGITTTWQTQ